MNINKPLSHKIKTNDINYIEIYEMKNKNINKIKNKKMNKTNQKIEEIEEEEIIENYPYEYYEEEEVINDKINEEEQNVMSNKENIIKETEPQPEPDQKINTKISKNESKNDEDVIDFDDENIENANKIEKEKEKEIKTSENFEIEDKDNQLDNIIKEKDNKSNEQIINEKENNFNNKFFENQSDKNDKEKINRQNLMNYSLDQEEIIDILNLNRENKKLELNSYNQDIKNILLNKINAKKLLEDIYEKEKKFKNAYVEYYSKLTETINNNYFQKIIENPINDIQNNKENSSVNKDYLIHQQTNTINDINIFCLNNNNNNNNYLNFNEQKAELYGANNPKNLNDNNNNGVNFKNNKNELFIFNTKNKKTNSAYEEYKKSKIKKSAENDKNIIHNEYIRHPTIILSIRKFLNEFNISIQNRTSDEYNKNPLLNYELYIDILNDLYYIDQNKLPQIYFINTSIYKQIWNFLIGLNNNIRQTNNSEDFCLDSNTLLIFLLILNGFFNNKKIISELEIELSWLNFENFEIIIMNTEYIDEKFGEIIDIRKKNILMKSNFSNNLFIINNIQKKYESENNSKGPEEILSDYFNSYTNNLNVNNNLIENHNNAKMEKIQNNSANKFIENNNQKKKINNNNNINKQLYAFKPRNVSNIKKKDKNIDKSTTLKKNNKSLNSLQRYKAIDMKEYSSDNINSELSKEKNNKRNINKKKFLNKIKYNELYTLTKNKDEISDIHINNFISNNPIKKKSSSKNISNNTSIKGKSGNYSNKVKQNRTDLKKLFKNNEYKDGTINERYEQIKRQRNENSKSKGIKTQINYEEYTNLDKFKDKNEQNQKHKYQFRKHSAQKKNTIFCNFKIGDKEYVLEHNKDENIEIEIMQFIQKNNITGISAKSILEKIKINQKNNSSEVK